MLLLIRLSGQRKRRRESNKRPNQPPFRKPERALEKRSSAHINKTTEVFRDIQKRYYLERRLFM